MKKIIFPVAVLLLFVSTTFPAQEKKTENKIDPQNAFQQIEKPSPLPEKLRVGFESISAKELFSLLNFLSSDLLEGRETATRGYDLASEYAASLFSLWGIKPAGDMPLPTFSRRLAFSAEPPRPKERSYFQEVPLRETTASKSQAFLTVNRSGMTRSREFAPDIDFTSRSTIAGTIKATVVFAGYGISEKTANYDDYKNIDVKGKWVMLLPEAPGKNNPHSPFQKDAKLKEKYAAPAMMTMRQSGGFNKIAQAEKLGAVGVLMLRSPAAGDGEFVRRILDGQKIRDDQPIIPKSNRRLSLFTASGQRMPWEPMPTLTISLEMASEILGKQVADLAKSIDDSLKPASFELKETCLELTTQQQTALTSSHNVIGYIEGSDPQLKNEAVVIGAHLDHLGRRGDYIYNGADDNGSGSAAVLALARAFALSPEKPKRTIIFALWTGEEEGLLGSRYYVDNPYLPLDKTVANLNIDMLSKPADAQMLQMMARMQNLDVKSEFIKKIRFDHFLAISYMSGVPKLLEAMKAANLYCADDLCFHETDVASSGGGSSDHASFHLKKVPWMEFLSSMGEDFHKPTDSIEKVNLDYMERMNRLLYTIAFLLAEK